LFQFDRDLFFHFTDKSFFRCLSRFDMAASYHVARGLFVTGRVLNLFDKQYQDALGYPALGRYYMLGMRYTFAGRD